MSSSHRYAKTVQGEPPEYMGPGWNPTEAVAFGLRVSLGGMQLEDAFLSTLPWPMSRLTLGSLLDRVFRRAPSPPHAFPSVAEIRLNPDLPDMFRELVTTFGTWRDGRSSLRFFANWGPELDLSQPVADHLSVYRPSGEESPGTPLLDLVVEERFQVVAHSRDGDDDRDELLRWLRETAFLYFLARGPLPLAREPGSERKHRLPAIAEALASRRLVCLDEEAETCHLAPEGRRLLERLAEEAGSYVDQYDIFRDVAYDSEAGTVEFGTGRGEDLRSQVFESEGMDAVRTVFLLSLYDGTLDGYRATWRDRILEEEFFDALLRPVLDYDRVEAGLLDTIIDAGLARREEVAEAAQRHRLQQDAATRARSRQV